MCDTMSAPIIQAGSSTLLTDQLRYKQLLTQHEELLTDYHEMQLLYEQLGFVLGETRTSCLQCSQHLFVGDSQERGRRKSYLLLAQQMSQFWHRECLLRCARVMKIWTVFTKLEQVKGRSYMLIAFIVAFGKGVPRVSSTVLLSAVLS